MTGHKEQTFIPYGKQSIAQDDIDAVVEVLKSGWLTTGPQVALFENGLKDIAKAKHAVTLSNGTAALHAVAHVLNLGPGDEVIVPTVTFAATANASAYVGATPVFADVGHEDMLIDPKSVQQKITPRTKAIFAVDFAGQACDYRALRKIADEHQLALVSDSCHAIGATYQGKPIADWADMVAFSFHPVKHICAGEGGAVITNNDLWAKRIRRFRNHGIDKDHSQRQEQGTWYYEQVELGYNYRLSDLHCALGNSQLKKLPEWIKRRQEIAEAYHQFFNKESSIRMLKTHDDREHTYHLVIVVCENKHKRDSLFEHMRHHQIGVNVHYTPVHLQPFYQKTFKTGPGDCPVAEDLYDRILTLPVYPGLKNEELNRVFGLIQEHENESLDKQKVV